MGWWLPEAWEDGDKEWDKDRDGIIDQRILKYSESEARSSAVVLPSVQTIELYMLHIPKSQKKRL